MHKRVEMRKQRHIQSLQRRRAAIDKALRDIAKMNGGLVFYRGGFCKLREHRMRLKLQKESRLILTESPENPQEEKGSEPAQEPLEETQTQEQVLEDRKAGEDMPPDEVQPENTEALEGDENDHAMQK